MRRLLYLTVLLLFAIAPAWAQEGEERETTTRSDTIRFARGKSAASVKGLIGPEFRDQFELRARPGQTISIDLDTADEGTYFDVYAAVGLEAVPVTPEGEKVRGEWSGRLPEGGTYYVNVMTDGEGGAYVLHVSIR